MAILDSDQFTAHFLQLKRRREEEEHQDREEQEQRMAAHEEWTAACTEQSGL